jgi:enamine deaminase RidA (YjgF/YER057c/UK114 family)
MEVTHLNPPSLHTSPAFSQGVLVSGPTRTIYVGGQNGAGETLREQTLAALANVEAVIRAADPDGSLHDVVSWQVASVAGQDPFEGAAAFGEAWGTEHPPPAITVLMVSDLGPPGALVEITAVAVRPG